MIEDEIYSLLSGNSTITDLVSTRIYPQIREQEDGLPAITYQMISQIHDYDLGGNNGLVEARIQINCFAPTILAAAQLADIIKNCLSGFQGGDIQGIILDETNDLPSIEPENEQMNVYAKTMDFFVMYKE